MKNEIKELKAELLKVFSKFEENEQEPKEGEWWWLNDNNNDYLLLIKGFVIGSQHKLTGANYSGKMYFYKNKLTAAEGYFTKLARKATDSEVIEAFTNYFRSQGFVSGKTKFKSAYSGVVKEYNEPLFIHVDGSIMTSQNYTLFDMPTITLATKIEEEKIMVDGKEVKILDKRTFKIGDYYFSKDAALELRTLNPIFQKILDKINEK